MMALEKINRFAMMEDTLYLGMALARAGYYDDIWRYWRRKWARNFEIIHEMKQLMQHFEARIYTHTAHGKIPLRLGIFTLQHHYGWGKEVQSDDDLGYLAEADKMPDAPFSEGGNADASQKMNEATTSELKAPVAIEETVCERPADATGRRYPIELTPEELLMETGISDIHEIERRMREDDPELAELEDDELEDEDTEYEIVTPDTYRRS